jgi:RNA polymerase sigma factor (TIGR02999 family)
MKKSPGDVTALLRRLRRGDEAAREELFTLTFDRMRKIAHGLLRHERPDHTLQSTALVNEAVAQLLQGTALLSATDRGHFFAVLTRAMRHVLIDHERRRQAEKRGGGLERFPIEAASDVEDPRGQFDRVELLDAIEALSLLHDRAAQVVTLRFLSGLPPAEVARHLGVSLSTVESDWRLARAWLFRELTSGA